MLRSVDEIHCKQTTLITNIKLIDEFQLTIFSSCKLHKHDVQMHMHIYMQVLFNCN